MRTKPNVMSATLAVALVAALSLGAAPANAENAPPPEDTTAVVAPDTTDTSKADPAPAADPVPDAADPADGDAKEPSDLEDPDAEEGDEEELGIEAMSLMAAPAAAAAVAAPPLNACGPLTTVVITSEGQLTYADKTGGSHSLQSDGMHIDWHGPDLTQSKSAGYIATNVDFADICTPAVDFSNTSGGAVAGLNLQVTVDGVIQGYIITEVGIPNYWANFTIPNVPGDPVATYRKAIGTLQDFYNGWWADDPNHVIKLSQAGYSGGSGSVGSGIIKSVTLGSTKYVFAAPPPVTCTPGVPTSVSVTDVAPQGFNASPTGSPVADTRSKGHIEYVPGGVNQVTEDTTSQSKSWFGRTVNVPATQYCGSFALTTVLNSGTIKPGLNVGWDLDNNGTQDFLSTVEPGVYTKTYWSNTAGVLPPSDPANPGNNNGQGGPYSGEVNDILANYPNAHVVLEALVQGSGVQTDSVTSSFSTPAYVYAFNRSAKPADVVTPTGTNDAYDCPAKTTTTTTSFSTVTYDWTGRSEWNGATFVMNNSYAANPAVASTVVSRPRAMTPAEEDANCPKAPPATSSTGSSKSDGTLSMTGGGDPRPLGGWAAAVLLLGGALLFLGLYRKTAQAE